MLFYTTDYCAVQGACCGECRHYEDDATVHLGMFEVDREQMAHAHTSFDTTGKLKRKTSYLRDAAQKGCH